MPTVLLRPDTIGTRGNKVWHSTWDQTLKNVQGCLNHAKLYLPVSGTPPGLADATLPSSGYPTWPCRWHPALNWLPHLAVQTPPRPQHLSHQGLHMSLLQQPASHPLTPRGYGLTWSPPHSAARSPHCLPPPRRSCRSARPPCLRPEPGPEPGAAARRPEHTRNAEPPAASRFAPAFPAACSRPPPLVAAGRRPSPAPAQGPLASMAAATTVWKTGRSEGQKATALALHAYGVGVGGAGKREELL